MMETSIFGPWGLGRVLMFLDFMASAKVLSRNESGLLAQKNREANIKLTTCHSCHVLVRSTRLVLFGLSIKHRHSDTLS